MATTNPTHTSPQAHQDFMLALVTITNNYPNLPPFQQHIKAEALRKENDRLRYTTPVDNLKL